MEKLIVITPPESFCDEIPICKDLFNAGLETLHVRKPGWNENQVSEWLRQFTDEELQKCVVHHHKDLVQKYYLKGLHISYSENLPTKTKGTFSCSLHSWKEAETASGKFDYIFISPVFDSISKISYRNNPDLHKVPLRLSHEKIFALGGIDESNIESVFNMGYYGAALLGYIWENPSEAVNKFEKINNLIYA